MHYLLARLELLRRIMKLGSAEFSWFGKLAVQKTIYLLQAVFGVNLGYRFDFHHLGPYSQELATNLSLGEQAGLWHARAEELKSASATYTGVKFEPTSQRIPDVIGAQADAEWIRIESLVREALAQLADCNGRDLELIATIHYLKNVQAVSNSELWTVLNRLKPKFSQQEFDSAKKQLSVLATN